MSSVIPLKCGALSAGILPSLGASILYFRHHDTPLLRETPQEAIPARDGRAFSAFPLIPFSNRVRAGEFRFHGQSYLLGRDAEDPRHALHGNARFYPWAETRRTDSYLRCALDYSPQNLDWPFAYHAWQAFALLEDRLRITLGLRNLHHGPAPAGIGLHPYFARAEGEALRFDAGFVWAKDAQDIPTHSIPDDGRFSFQNSHAIEAGLIDNDYGAWGGGAEITAPGRPTLTLTGSKIFDHLVLYTPEGKPYFAAEPVTHRPDALNPNGDPRDQGMNILQPGAALEGVIEIRVTP